MKTKLKTFLAAALVACAGILGANAKETVVASGEKEFALLPPVTLTGLSATAITYGQTLNASTISGTATAADFGEVAGTFTWTNPDTKPNVSDSGTTAYSVTFTPTDANDSKTGSGSITLTVNAKALTVAVAATGRTYDGTTTVALTGGELTGVVNGDDVKATVPATGALASKDAGTGRAVTVGEVTLSGAKAGNYALTQPTGVTADITTAPLTVTAKPKAITYGDAPTNDGVTYAGLVNGEEASVLGGALAYDYSYAQYGDVGDSYTITPKGLTSSNYAISFAAGTLTVNAKALTVAVAATGRTYDGTTTVALTGGELTGVVNGDDVKATVPATGALASKDAGTGRAVTVGEVTLSGAKAGNYALTQPTGVTADIEPLAAELVWSETAFTYDGAAHKPSCAVSNLIGEDACAVTVSGEQVAAGTYTATAASLSDANYKLPGETTVQFTIAKSKEKPFKDGSSDPEGEGYEPPENPNDWASLTNAAPYSTFDCVTNYDGETHTIDTNALVAAYTAVCVEAPTVAYGVAEAGGGGAVVTNWSAAPVELVDAGATCVWYRVSVPNYEDLVRVAKVVVAPRAVTLTSASETWVYDGQAHSNTTVTVGGAGFVDGEGMTAGGFPTITEVGSVPNAFTYAFAEGTKGENYNVTCVTGTLAVTGYWVSYDGNGAAGEMATDLFVPGVPTNLTANAFSAVGYTFAGWTTNGSDIIYADCASGVDFAESGETLALKAKWTVDPAGVKPADYADLTNLIAQATLPVTLTLDEDIELQPGDKVVIPEGKSITFAGDGKFDVSGIVPTLWNPVTVGEGFATEDALALFVTKGVSMPVFDSEGGKVVLHARGESEDFPWVLDEAKGVKAWVDSALTNLAGVVIDNGMPTATNAIDLVSLTNNIAVYGYEPAATPFNALLAVGKVGGAVEYVKPVEWITTEGESYATIADALAADETAVVPNFETKETEIPQEIVETVTGDDDKTYTAVVENVPAEDVEEPVKVIRADGLINLATNEQKNVKLVVTPTNVEDVAQTTVYNNLTNVLLTALKDQEGHPMRIVETNLVDLSVYYNETKQTTLGRLIAIHIPWTINAEYVYGVSRMHGGVAQAIPEGAANANDDGEYFELGADEIILHVKNFSDYLISGTMPLVPRIGASIKWKLCYATGSLFAQLKLSVTNGQASAVQNLKFVFEDRDDGSKLWGASSDRTKMGAVLTGWTGLPAGTWRYVNVDGAALTTVQGGNTGTFGVQSGIDTANGTVAVADRKIELYKKNAVISAAEANEFLGWVVWEAYGEQHCAPVGENAPMVANVARMLRAPLSVAGANKAAAYGNAYLMDGSDPDCEIAAFSVGEGTIRGRIALKGAGGQENAPGGNVKATLYGATSLDSGFASCGTIPLAADGTFTTAIPAGKAFFRVKLEVVDVIK